MNSFEIMQDKAAASPNQPACITLESVRSYLADLAARGRRAGTVRAYAAWLRAFYDCLPPEKAVTWETLPAWRESLLEGGYSPGTVNTHLSAANGLLGYLGRRDLQSVGQLETVPEPRPELNRAEYLRLLQAARAQGRERVYLLVKVFALTGVRVGELPNLTAEAVEAGRARRTDGGEPDAPPLPACLRRELAEYLRRQGIQTGPVFRSRTGKPLPRTQVTAEIQALSQDARVEEVKCNPHCLRKLYQVTQAEIESRVRLLAEASYEQMLAAEQSAVGWENPPACVADHENTYMEGDL